MTRSLEVGGIVPAAEEVQANIPAGKIKYVPKANTSVL